MTNVAQDEAPKTPAPGESKPKTEETRDAGDKQPDKSNQQK